MPPPSERRLPHLDALRGLAVLLVLLDHTLSENLPGYVARVRDRFAVGHLGVCLFFVVSGYVISRSLTGHSLRTFWRRRIYRLYPAYWLSVALIIPAIRCGALLSVYS